MFGISFEHILIVGVILIVLGPKRLPEIGNSMGKAIRNFKDSISGITQEPEEKKLVEQKPAPAPITEPVKTAETSDTTPKNS